MVLDYYAWHRIVSVFNHRALDFYYLYLRFGELVGYAQKGEILRSDVEIDNSEKITPELSQKRDRLFQLLSVHYFIYKENGTESIAAAKEDTIWENPTWLIKKNEPALPRVFLTQKYEVITEDKKILEKLFSSTFFLNWFFHYYSSFWIKC